MLYMLLKKANHPIFVFVESLFLTKKSANKVVSFPLTDDKLFAFSTSQTGVMTFINFNVTIR